MKSISNYSVFERISSNMARNFGTIKKGHEEDYAMLMMPIESNLMKTCRKTGNNNGRRVIEAIKICLFTIDGYLNDCEYDFGKYLTTDNQDFVHAALMAFDPFTNDEIKELISHNCDLDSKDDLCEYFTTPIKCLLRIEASVEQWTKGYGASGYFDFLEGHMGHAVSDDDEMNFTIEAR